MADIDATPMDFLGCYFCDDARLLPPLGAGRARPCPLCVEGPDTADRTMALRSRLLRAADGQGELSAREMRTAVDWLDDLLAASTSAIPGEIGRAAAEDTLLLDFVGEHGFGTWHDARTKRWVSMAGNAFADPRAAIRAVMERWPRGRIGGRRPPSVR